MSINPRYCGRFVSDNGCPLGQTCRLRHDIRKCSCDLVILLCNFLPHTRGKRHQQLLIESRRRRQNFVPNSQRTRGRNGEEYRRCGTCRTEVLFAEFSAHTEEHRRQRQAEIQTAFEAAQKDKEGITASDKEGIDFGILEVDETSEDATKYMVLVRNSGASSSTIVLQSCKLRSSSRGDGHGSKFSARIKESSKVVRPSSPRHVVVTFHPSYAGRYEDTLELLFLHVADRRYFIITRNVLATVGSREDHELLAPTAPYTRRAIPAFLLEQAVIIPSLRPPIWTPTKWVEKLLEFKAPASLLEAAYRDGPFKAIHQTVRRLMPMVFNERTYGQWFQTMLYIEEEQMRQDLDAYSLTGADLIADYPRYKLKVEGLAENRPSVLVGDYILIGREGDVDQFGKRKWYEGRVHQVRMNEVSLRFSDDFSTYRGTKFDVRFVLNRLPYRRMHHALVNAFHPARVLFPSAEHIRGSQRVTAAQRDRITLVNRELSGDEEQLDTVAAIVNRAPGSIPFVVFGPPGTGKTVTIVEAMQQLLKNPEVRILACAPNNSAADLIAQKLIGLGKSQLLRLNSLTRRVQDLPTSLKDFALINENTVFAIPAVEELRKYRVIVATCLSGGVPANMGVKRGHFTHIFIDEAGQGKEPEVMVPIKSSANEKTNIILAGDNQQLGPVVHSKLANVLGLKMSYLARLMDRDIYSLDTGRGITIVKLIKNFRSHPDILEFPNNQFYASELQPCGDPVLTRSLENSDELPKKRFPLIFHGIVGRDEREASSPSFFNVDEVTLVKKYCATLVGDRKNGIRAEHIGVITPYHAQRCKILNVFYKDTKLKDIKVGSVEEFQGQERRIIVISTVRSNSEYVTADIRRSLGFVANERRFNVAITRAQAMLIVIGNPIVLSLDPLWREFLNFIHTRGGWRGRQIDWNPEEPVFASGSNGYAAQRRTQADIAAEETIQRIKSLIMQKHEDSDFEVDFVNEDDAVTGAVERPIIREAE